MLNMKITVKLLWKIATFADVKEGQNDHPLAKRLHKVLCFTNSD